MTETTTATRKSLARVANMGRKVDRAELELELAIRDAHTEGISIRRIAEAAGLGSSTVHRLISRERL